MKEKMVKVSVERFKSVISECFLHRRRRFLPFDIYRPNLIGLINRANNQWPKDLDSMFPSLFDGVRLGSWRKAVPGCDRSNTKESVHPSSSVRIIPIIVEGDESERNTVSKTLNEVNPIILDADDVAEIIDCTIDDSSSRSINNPIKYHKSHISAFKKSIDSPVVLDDEDLLSDIDSKCPLQKTSKACQSEMGEANLRKSGLFDFLTCALPISDKPHWGSTGSEEQSIQSTSSAVLKDIAASCEDIDCSNTVTSRDSTVNNKSDMRTDDGHDVELENSPPPNHPVYEMLTKKLEREHRKIHYVTGDGNCFFRALSKILYGVETYHKAVRRLIIDIIATNKNQFAQFVDGEDVPDHIEKMSEAHCWATTCEIYAAATVLQRDIFMFTPNHLKSTYSWLLFTPVFKISEGQTGFTHHPCCVTLCNTNGNHYDIVVADHGKCNCFMPHPELDGINAHIDLT